MRGWHGTMNRVSSEHVISKPLAHKLHLHHVRYWTGLFVVFFSFQKKNLFKHLRVKGRAQSFQYRFVQSCHPFVRIQMVEHSSPWTVRYSSGFGNPRSALVSRLLPFSTVRLKALWSVCGHRCRRHSGSGFWKMCCAQKLHIVRKIWGIRFAIPSKPTGLWKLAHPVCAWKRLSSLDIFRYVHLYIDTLNVISIRLWLILRCRFYCLKIYIKWHKKGIIHILKKKTELYIYFKTNNF